MTVFGQMSFTLRQSDLRTSLQSRELYSTGWKCSRRASDSVLLRGRIAGTWGRKAQLSLNIQAEKQKR